MGKVKSSAPHADVKISEVEHVSDLSKVSVNRRSRYDWDLLCNGKTHTVWIRKAEKQNVRSAFSRAYSSRHLDGTARWQIDTEKEIDGEVWGEYWLQTMPLPDTAA